ncbi:MAG: S8 family serine peptidase [Chitinophagales bacterium]
MFIKIIFAFLSFFLLQSTFAQKHKFGIKETQYINNLEAHEKVSIFVKGDYKNVSATAKKYNAVIKYSYQGIFAISIAQQDINAFANNLKGSALELPLGKGKLMMDTALIVNNVVAVHQGLSPLAQSSTGKDVIIGILDSGIYFDHPDFKKADGSTRIRYIWDQNLSASSASPLPYAYGKEWSWIEIDNGSCNHVEPASQYGHGTTVAGAACGNGLGSGHFMGVAPESEIIAVAVDYYGNDFLSNLVDAIDYVFKKADALGKPCVINTSLGTYFGSHDGKDLATQMIDAIIEERSGRAVVASAGNGNNINDTDPNYTPTHLSYSVNSDTSFTWFKIIPSDGQVYFDLWAEKSDFENVSFALQNDNPTNFVEYARTPFLNIADDFQMDLTEGFFHSEIVFDDALQNHGKVDYFIEETEGRYHIEFLITPDSTSHIWRFITTGTGTFDIWSSATYQGTSNMIYNNLPPSFVVEDIVNYKTPDNKKTIVSSWQCSDKVITVGNYSNRAAYFDVDSIYRLTNETPGEIYYRSSEGPTRDNRLKPDISATGNQTFATGNLNFINLALSVNRPKVSYDTLHARNGGTSMASPIVAGAVALYLEQNPDAYWYETKAAIIQSAKRDAFTGTTENTQYGYGKLDAFALMQFNAIVGCTDVTAFNYNAQANVEDGSCEAIVLGCLDNTALNFNENANTDDGSCIAVVNGCMDSLAINFNENANTEDGSCEYETGIEDINNQAFKLIPNPVKEISYVYFEENGIANLNIFDVSGKLIKKGKISNQKPYKLSKKSFSKGVYYIEIENANITESIKFVVE